MLKRVYFYFLNYLYLKDSLLKYDEELPSGDNSIQLNVVRKQGVNGHVVVRWKLTGEHNGINDITPVEGIVSFFNIHII